MKTITVLIADNQTLTREGIMAVLSLTKDIKVIGTVSTLIELKQMIAEFKPNVIIMDYHFAHSFDELDLKAKQTQFHFSQVLILSNRQQKKEILEIIDLGVKNYLFKECSSDELTQAIRAAANDEQFFCQQTLLTLFGNEVPLTKVEDIPMLSPRETEIVHLIAEGLPNKEIAERLFLSIHTVKTHRKNIIKKLGFTFKNAAGLTSITKLLP